MIGVIFPIAFILLLSFFSVVFYGSLLVDLCVVFVFVFMSLDSSLSNQECILTCLLSF